MIICFIRANEVLKTVDTDAVDSYDDMSLIVDDLRKLYDNQEVQEYRITFNKGVKVGQTHDFNSIETSSIERLQITLRHDS